MQAIHTSALRLTLYTNGQSPIISLVFSLFYHLKNKQYDTNYLREHSSSLLANLCIYPYIYHKTK